MLQKQYRLPGAIRLTSPTSFRSSIFLLKVSSNGLTYSRYGFIVRKTVDKRAVVRNRIRRVFRSCIEEMQQEIKPGYDMLFFLTSQILEMKREALYNELHEFLKEKNYLQ